MECIQHDGRTLFRKSGTIEAVGNSGIFPNGTAYSLISFADGKIVRNVVVDGVLDGYVAPGRTGQFYMVRVGSRMILVGANIDGVGARVSDDRSWSQIVWPLAGQAVAYTVFGLPFSFFIIGIPLVILGIVTMVRAVSMFHVASVVKHLRANGLPGRTSAVSPETAMIATAA
jgi:hypothetical protein